MSKRVLTEFNLNDYDNNMYTKVFDKSTSSPLSIIQEPDLQYQDRIQYLFVTSSDRDTGAYPVY
ncbi:hypothetical protein EB118_12405 [bacterium]|nr:hypothetical protein [bacterium]